MKPLLTNTPIKLKNYKNKQSLPFGHFIKFGKFVLLLIFSQLKKKKEYKCYNCDKVFQSYFANLDSSDMLCIQERKETRPYKKGELVFVEGSKSQGIFCIREGKLKIFKNGSDGREHITRLAFSGEFVGMKALLTGSPYSVSAQTLEESIICFISKNEFFELTIKYPEFNNALISCLSQQLVEAEAKMISLAHKPVRERLADTLLYLYQQYLHKSTTPDQTYLNLTRQDLANIVGTAQETVIRLLADWKEQKIVAIKGRKIFILSPGKLKKIANGLF